MEAILEIQGLCKRYADFQLSDISLSMAPGTITGLVGANGAGKSTTIKLILNLIRRDAGNIRVFGQDNLTEEARGQGAHRSGVRRAMFSRHPHPAADQRIHARAVRPLGWKRSSADISPPSACRRRSR